LDPRLVVIAFGSSSVSGKEEILAQRDYDEEAARNLWPANSCGCTSKSRQVLSFPTVLVCFLLLEDWVWKKD
jgi:hypothetical protein